MADIKWRKSDIKKLSIAVRKFNTSLTKLSKQNPDIFEAGLYPKKMNVEELKNRISTRRDFNRTIAKIDRWFRPGARDIVMVKGAFSTTKWALNEARYDIQAINIRRRAQLNKLSRNAPDKLKLQLKDVSLTAKLEELQRRAAPAPWNNNTPQDISNSWEMFMQKVMGESYDSYVDRKNAQYFLNYHSALYENLSDEHSTIISDIIEDYRLTGEELFQVITTYPELEIEFIYSDESEVDKFDYLEYMLPRAIETIFGVERYRGKRV